MSSLQAVVDELQYANLHNEEQTETLETVDLTLGEISTNIVSGFEQLLKGIIVVLESRMVEMASTLEEAIPAVYSEPVATTSTAADEKYNIGEALSTEDKREQRNLEESKLEAALSTSMYVEKIYDLMTEQQKEERNGLMSGLSLPSVVPVGMPGGSKSSARDVLATGGLAGLGANLRKHFTRFGRSLARGGIGALAASLVMDLLGIDSSDFERWGRNVEQMVDDIKTYDYSKLDATEIGNKITAGLNSAILSGIDLAFAENGSTGKGLENAMYGAIIGSQLGGPIGALLGGLAGFISGYFSSSEVKQFYTDLRDSISAFIDGITGLLTGDYNLNTAKTEYNSIVNNLETKVIEGSVIKNDDGTYSLTERGRTVDTGAQLLVERFNEIEGYKGEDIAVANIALQPMNEEVRDLEVRYKFLQDAVAAQEFKANGFKTYEELSPSLQATVDDPTRFNEMQRRRRESELAILEQQRIGLAELQKELAKQTSERNAVMNVLKGGDTFQQSTVEIVPGHATQKPTQQK